MASAWHAEQLRQRRERLGYWLGIGEVYLRILGFTLITQAIFVAMSKGISQ
jgi:hypothetical protein